MELSKKVTFITGFEKNCGKTTFLNYLLSKYDSNKKIMCLTVGLDYDGKGILDDDYKPKVSIKKNWKALTNTSFLRSFNFSYEINDVYDIDVMGGKPVVITPKYDSYIKLSSPGPDLLKILDSQKFHVERFFIDGAFDRITQISRLDGSEFYYVFKVNPANIERVSDKIKLLNSFINAEVKSQNMDFLNEIEKDFEILGDTLYLKGALTYSKINCFPSNVKNIVVSDFTKVFLGYNDWVSFSQKYKVLFSYSFKFCGYVINLYDISIKDFESRFEKKTTSKFIYNPYEHRKIL